MYTTTWMDLKGIMLSEKKAKLKRLHIVWFHFYDSFKMTTLHYREEE